MGKVNAMKENYQKILDEMIAGLEEKGEVPKLLLHSCCAPVSYTHLTLPTICSV